MILNRRHLLAMAASAGALWRRPARAQTGALVIYSAFEDGQIGPLVTEFNKAHPSINVRHFHQPGEELVGTLTLELQSGHGKADVAGLNEASLRGLHDKLDAIEPYEAAEIGKLRQDMRDANHLFTPAFLNLYLIHYNLKSIQPIGVPKAWADLTDPKYKNLIAMADPASSQSVQSFVWFIADNLGASDPQHFGWNYFTRLAANAIRLEASHGTIRDLTVSGERPLGVQLLANAQTAMNRGEATGLVWPSEGSPGELSAFSMLRSAANKPEAKLWLDFIASPAGQALMPRSLGGAPIRTDIAYKYPDGTPVADVKVVRVDATFVAANRRSQLRKFRAAIGQ